MTDLKIYWSNLTPTRNGWVDEIESYLDTLEVYYHCENFQYQRFENELEIVIPVSQADLSNQEVGNYVRFYQDNIAWYYFVMSYKWTSKTSLRLSLSIDSVNTFVGTHVHFSPKTVIEREHEDRYVESNTATKLIKRFDPENEEIPITQERTTNTVVTQNTNNNLDWFLIYKTNQDASIQENNPISCYCIANDPLVISKTGGGASQTLTPSDLPANQYNYVVGVENLGGQITANIQTGYDANSATVIRNNRALVIGNEYRKVIPTYQETPYGQASTGADIEVYRATDFRFVSDGTNIFIEVYGDFVRTESHQGSLANPSWSISSGFVVIAGNSVTVSSFTINELNFTRVTYDGSIPIQYAQQLITTTQVYNIGSQVTRSTIGYNSVDKTDAKIIKIIRLPYAPCEVTYNSQTGVYTFPGEWTYESGYMKLNDASLSTEFESSLDDVNWDFFVQDIPSVPKVQDNRLAKDDPKLATSQFSTYKFLYDSFAQEVKLEKFVLANGTQTQIALPIKFKPTNTINSRFAFKLNWNSTSWGSASTIKVSGDYDEYLLANRNNEETIFSSDYLNYLRNGYNYDKKVKSEQSAMSYLMGGLQVAGAAISFATSAFTGGASVAAGVALTTGAITTFAGAGYQQYSNEQAMAQKIKNLQMQAVNVSGSDDVNLLKYYSQNKLYFVVYEPLQFQKDALNNLFYYCGYKHKKMGIPNTTSRTWFNFIQCKPVFEEEENSQPGAPYNKFWDDIKTRFMAGVTRYHRVQETYDWSQEKENWETFLIAFDINDMSAVEWSSETFPSYTKTTFTGTWNGPTLNNTTQYIKVNFYDTEADWDDEEPNDSAIATVSANKTFTTSYEHQGLYAVTFQVVDTINPQKSSEVREYFNIY